MRTFDQTNQALRKIFLLILVTLTFFGNSQSLSTKKAKTLLKLEQARAETNDSIKASLYREVGYDRKYFPKDSARILIDEGLRFNEERGVMDIHHLLLKLYSAKQNYSSIPTDSSISALKALIPLSDGLNPRGKLYVLKDIGLNFKLLGEYDSSIYYLDQAKQVAVASKDLHNMAKVTGHIAENYTRLDNFAKGKEILETLLKEYPKAKKLQNVLSTLAYCYNDGKQYNKTIELYEEQLLTQGKWTLAADAPGFVSFYCGALVGNKEYNKAEKELTEHITFNRSKQRYSSLNTLYQYFSALYQNTKNYHKALACLDSAAKYKKNASQMNFILGITKQKTEIFTAMGNKDSASHYLSAYEKLLKEKFDKNTKAEFAKSLTYYETREKEQRILLLEKEKELAEGKLWKLVYLSVIGAVLLIVIGVVYNTRLVRKNAASNQAMVEAQLTSIRSQLNPHFMFNALNSIKNYIVKNDSRAASNYLAKFTRLMRGILDLSSKPTIPLEKELDMLQLYVELEQMRFKNVFTYSSVISDQIDISDITVPPLFLQPFVENSIKHGLTPLEGQRAGELILTINKTQNYLVFEIADNGIGRNEKSKINSHVSQGVALSQKRIDLTNNDSKGGANIIFFDMKDTKGNPCGTKVQIKLRV